MQNNSPRWLKTVCLYFPRLRLGKYSSPRSPVTSGSCFAQFPHEQSIFVYCKDVINMSSLTAKVNNCSKNGLSLFMTFKKVAFVMLNLCLMLMLTYLMLNKLKLNNLSKVFSTTLFLPLLHFPYTQYPRPFHHTFKEEAQHSSNSNIAYAILHNNHPPP